MKTVTIQIGNSDDKLTQKEWSQFAKKCDEIVRTTVGAVQGEIHFSGMSFADAPWQNAAWIVNMPIVSVACLREKLTELRRQFRQESVALTMGDTNFI